jgi:hypothetical protein
MRLSRRAALGGLAGSASQLVFGSARADGAVNYVVPGIVPLLTQPSSMTCWATVGTMLTSWKNNSSYDIPTALAAIGQKYVDMFNANQGLAPGDKQAFLTAMGATFEAPQNYLASGWDQLLRQYGPLWVTTAEGAGFSIHARILTGISGDGTFDGTTLTIADPADGQLHTETVTAFAQKFEAVAIGDLGSSGELRPQVVHYP